MRSGDSRQSHGTKRLRPTSERSFNIHPIRARNVESCGPAGETWSFADDGIELMVTTRGYSQWVPSSGASKRAARSDAYESPSIDPRDVDGLARMT